MGTRLMRPHLLICSLKTIQYASGQKQAIAAYSTRYAPINVLKQGATLQPILVKVSQSVQRQLIREKKCPTVPKITLKLLGQLRRVKVAYHSQICWCKANGVDITSP